jgi:hypothetical protein
MHRAERLASAGWSGRYLGLSYLSLLGALGPLGVGFIIVAIVTVAAYLALMNRDGALTAAAVCAADVLPFVTEDVARVLAAGENRCLC